MLFQGDRLLVGIKDSDYTMYVGGSAFSPLEVFSNKLVCTAPSSTPAPHPDDSTTGAFNVRVRALFIVNRISLY